MASPADFAGADDIIINLSLAQEREREHGIEFIELTPYSLIITSYNRNFQCGSVRLASPSSKILDPSLLLSTEEEVRW